jgi:PhzF family phenazine biosynthesis protein
MSETIYQVDAFTSQPFAGNPAAVCLLTRPRPDEWLLKVAAEMNLSETAFLLREGACYRLRWFTPKVEVELCGHATLASAHILFETRQAKANETVHFFTQSGELKASLLEDWIELDFPTLQGKPIEAQPGLLSALGVNKGEIWDYGTKLLVEVAGEQIVRALKPDFSALLKLPLPDVIVTSRCSTDDFDFISRYFAPHVGINEDPVTGSAHCALAPYWSSKLGKNTFAAYQASARGGILHVRLEGERTFLRGQAVTVLSGELKA